MRSSCIFRCMTPTVSILFACAEYRIPRKYSSVHAELYLFITTHLLRSLWKSCRCLFVHRRKLFRYNLKGICQLQALPVPKKFTLECSPPKTREWIRNLAAPLLRRVWLCLSIELSPVYYKLKSAIFIKLLKWYLLELFDDGRIRANTSSFYFVMIFKDLL